MESNKEEFTKIKVTDAYGTTITKKLSSDVDVDTMMQAWRDVMLALGFRIDRINEYIEPN